MARLILHVGTHKTATTTIQNVFHHNAALLARHGIIYPKIGPSTGHHGLTGDWYRDLAPHLRFRGGSRQAWLDIADRYGRGPGTVFLSSETLSVGNPNGAPDYAEIRRMMAPFDEILVLCVLREQWQFMQSLYLEVSRKIPPPPPAELVRNALAGGYCVGMWTNYLGFHDRLLTVFAPEELRFLDFDAARQSEGGILGAVLRTIGCDLRADQLNMNGHERSNPSPPPLPTWMGSVLARPDPAPKWLLADGDAVCRQIFGETVRTCLFTHGELADLDRHFTPLNAALSERLAPIQPDFALSRTPEKTLRTLACRNQVSADLWVRMARLGTRRLLATDASAQKP